MKKSLIALSCAVACCSSIALASGINLDQSKLYVPIAIGKASPTVDGQKDAAIGDVGLGYRATEYWGTQLVLGYYNSKNTVSNKSSKDFLWQAEGLAYLPKISNRFEPYFAGGLAKQGNDQNSNYVDMGFGVNFPIDAQFSGGVHLRHFEGFKSTDTNINTVTAGLNWNFGQTHSAGLSNPLSTKQKALFKQAKVQLKDYLPQGVKLCDQGGASNNQSGCVTIDGDQVTMHLNVKFIKNYAQFPKDGSGMYNTQVKNLANFMKAYPNTKVTLNGYASNTGPHNFNQKLSQDRAQTIKASLAKFGVSSDRVDSEGLGTQNPMADNATEQGRALNRRVEAQIVVPMTQKA